MALRVQGLQDQATFGDVGCLIQTGYKLRDNYMQM